MFPHRFCDLLVAMGIGMDAVFLIQFRHPCDAGEEVGQERGLLGSGEASEDLRELCDIVGAHVFGHRYPGDQDADRGVRGTRLVDDRGEVLLRRRRVDAAQAIIATEGEQQQVGFRLEQPWQAA